MFTVGRRQLHQFVWTRRSNNISMQQHYLFLVIYFTINFDANRADIEDKSLLSLAQLPLDKLLHVKNSLDNKHLVKLLGSKTEFEIELDDDEELDEDQDFIENPLPLKGDWFKTKRKKSGREPSRRGDWEEEKPSGKKGDIQAIFQSTITILAFLAFGGYLLCMVCMAIRNNQGMMTTTTPAPASIIVAGRKKRRVTESPIGDDLFYSLQQLAEGYTRYHTMNKKK